MQNHHRCQAQWQAIVTNALYLEDVEIAETTKQLPVKWIKLSIWGRSTWPQMDNGLFDQIKLPYSVRFLWHVTLKRPLLQVTIIFY